MNVATVKIENSDYWLLMKTTDRQLILRPCPNKKTTVNYSLLY